MVPTKEPIAGEKRLASMFRVRLSTCSVSTLDLLFTKAKETKVSTTITLGVKVRNMKMDFNTGGTWRRVGK